MPGAHRPDRGDTGTSGAVADGGDEESPAGGDPRSPRRFGRRGLLGAGGLAAGLALGGDGWVPRSSAAEPVNWETMDPAERVDQVRARLFRGPIANRIDLDALDPDRQPDSSLIGVSAVFQHMGDTVAVSPEDLLAFARAVGIKWLRSGLRYKDWNWDTGGPNPVVRRWMAPALADGFAPLLQTNARYFIGSDGHDDRWLRVARAAAEYWGEDLAAVQFDNEPHMPWSEVYGGGYWGGGWLEPYARFVENTSQRMREDYPWLSLVNGAHLPSVAISQLKQTAPALDGMAWHHYSYKAYLPPEFSALANDQRFPETASSKYRVPNVAADYLRHAEELMEPGQLPAGDSLRLWMTEAGIPSQPVSELDPPPNTLARLSEGHQAKWLARMMVTGLVSSMRVFFFTLWDLTFDRPSATRRYGLVTRELKPKTALFVLGRISALIGGAPEFDSEFTAEVTALDIGDGPQLFDKNIGRSDDPDRQTPVRENVRTARFVRADGNAVLTVWSTHPVRQPFEPRRATIEINRSLGSQPIVVDVLSGASWRLPDSARTVTASGERVDIDVLDYPVLILGAAT